MIGNYFSIGWRNLIKNRNYNFLNVLGLTLGLTTVMFIALYVRDETSYDKFIPDSERIYRIGLERKYPGRSRHYAIIPQSYAGVIKDEFPSVESYTRIFGPFNQVFKWGDKSFEEQKVISADSNLFSFMGMEMFQGDAETALLLPNTIAISESLAKKIFGNTDPIGEKIKANGNDNFIEVRGVFKDLPHNSHLDFDMVYSNSGAQFLAQPNFINFSSLSYLKLKEGADPMEIESALPDLVVKYASGQVLNSFGVNYEEYQRQGNGYRYFLQALPDIYLNSKLEAEMKVMGSKSRVYFFMAIAALILLIACINFMNLATARSASRAREVGIRKILGSNKASIAIQFLSEAITVTLVSALLAYGLTFLLLDKFNDLTNKSFEFSELLSAKNILLVFIFAVFTGLLSGAYPAFALSSFKPINTMKSDVSNNASGFNLRNYLVVFQFGITTFLIICSILVYQQYRYTQTKDLGFIKESIVTLKNAGGMTTSQQETFKKELAKQPGVVGVSGCNSMPGEVYFGVSFKAPGNPEMTTGSGLIVDEGFVECMGMELAQGRAFAENFNDSLSLVINEAAVREFEITDPIGKRLVTNDNFLVNGLTDASFTIVGVVEDFHFQSLHQTISPLFLINNNRSFTPGVDGTIVLRLSSQNIGNTLSGIEGLWNEFEKNVPFRYAFFDNEWAALYEQEVTAKTLSQLFTILAIVIACLGLLALSAFTAEKRAKEISIRKVLGATNSGIVGMLSYQFIKLVLISFVIAAPIAWYAMNEWLSGFAYRISIEWWYFLVAGILVSSIALLTISSQSIRAALANPINNLRGE